MADLVLDTGALADLLAQYFNLEDRSNPKFLPSTFLTVEVTRLINHIVRISNSYIIVSSVMAVVEIVRKWDEIVAGRFYAYQLAAFLESPPEWFSFDPMDEDVILLFGQVPSVVLMPDNSVRSIEWTDAVHAATALGRDKGILVTADRILIQIPHLQSLLSRR